MSAAVGVKWEIRVNIEAERADAALPRGEPELRPVAAPAEEPPAEPYRLRSHPLRHVLNNELHARPFAALSPPERVSHLAVHSGEDGAAEDHACLAQLCERYALPPPRHGMTHFSQDCGAFRLKWERHTEFVTYTFFRHGAVDDPFRMPAIEAVAHDWLDRLRGRVLVAAHVALLGRETPAPGPEDLTRHFQSETLCGSLLAGGAAAAFTDFRIHADGFSRILIHDRGLAERQAGRLIQRLLEIQTYRMMALLALPLAREVTPEIVRCERELAAGTMSMAGADGATDERGLLDRLTQLAASIERLSATTSYRFRATGAYHVLVRQRIEELREERIAGLQTFAEFMDRRFLPAMRTCSATAERLESVSQRVTRASQLLHTRVGIAVQEQHRDALQSVDRRARVQLILQEMVEGLSVVAITYYSVGLLAHALRPLKPFQVGFEVEVMAGAATPVIFASVWFVLRRLRKRRFNSHNP